MAHSEMVEKKEQEYGYYPQINRCAVCGYPVASRKGILLLVGMFASALVTIAVLVTRPLGIQSVSLLILCMFGMISFGIVAEMEMRRFNRAQRQDYLERQ